MYDQVVFPEHQRVLWKHKLSLNWELTEKASVTYHDLKKGVVTIELDNPIHIGQDRTPGFVLEVRENELEFL